MLNKNIFCKKEDLTNESSVEQFFVIRLLKDFGYKDSNIKPKQALKTLVIGKGVKKEKYRPDYVIVFKDKPRIVIEVKDPNEIVEDYLYQVSGYALSINQEYEKQKPVAYCILTNGLIFKVYKWDRNKPLLTLEFGEFEERNPKYHLLKEILSLKNFGEGLLQTKLIKEEFEFRKPEISEINGIFRACHNLIWKKEKISPTDAFYEFSKLFFVKLNHDREIHNGIIKQNKIPKEEDFIFSLHWIESQRVVKNPINEILFKNLREGLEEDIFDKKRKRIFEKNEELNLKPSTIKEVVKLLEHLDFHAIDEDLNGRMFETFLNATIRGKDLGQFFTPRTVVKFMVQLADLKVKKDHIDRVLDACCGSGGFLIDAMVDILQKIDSMNLTNYEKDKLRQDVIKEHLWGADANLKISRIARMNMYLHGDGGSRIYWLPDSLDKKIEIEEGTPEELKREAQEFRDKIIKDKLKFDVVLTNPPFSMKYESKKEDERTIIENYEIAYKEKDRSKQLRSSLKSNVLFLERYYDLLKPHGKLITIIDESVLNASSEKDFRDFIKDRFILKAIVSLPWNTFVNADVRPKTSVLFLIKKEKEDETQPKTFMAISENVGHSDTGKSTLDKCDLDKILNEFRKFENA